MRVLMNSCQMKTEDFESTPDVLSPSLSWNNKETGHNWPETAY